MLLLNHNQPKTNHLLIIWSLSGLKFTISRIMYLREFKLFFIPSLWSVIILHEKDWACISQKQPPEVLYKKGVLKKIAKFTKKHLYQNLFFNKAAGLATLKKETLAQVFFCEFCKNFENTFFIEYLRWLLLRYTNSILFMKYYHTP